MPERASYRCRYCKTEFQDEQRPLQSHVDGAFIGWQWQTECPGCGNLYVERIDSVRNPT